MRRLSIPADSIARDMDGLPMIVLDVPEGMALELVSYVRGHVIHTGRYERRAAVPIMNLDAGEIAFVEKSWDGPTTDRLQVADGPYAGFVGYCRTTKETA